MNSLWLDLDVGNTRIKWRCGSARGSCSLHDFPQLNGEVTRVRISTVSADRIALQASIRERYGVDPEFATSTRYLGGVSNGYQDESQLGVDRWLALVAAFNREHRAVMVVDAGTALTIDLVNSEGLHLGGYIVPGMQMLRQALARNTVQVQTKSVQASNYQLKPASNTDQAVHNGCLAMLCSFIEDSYRASARQYRQVFRLILSGGDSDLIVGASQLDFIVDHDLIFDGLALALP